MKELTLPSDQIIIPDSGDIIRNDDILRVYFRVFNQGQGNVLPPCIVTHKDKIDPTYLARKFNDTVGATQFYRKLMNAKPEYLLLDGTHKTLAATLTYSPISVLELESDHDLAKIREMVQSGELFSFPHNDPLTEIANEFIDRIFQSEEITTVEERTIKLIADNDLPQYMEKRYLEKFT